MLVTSDNVRPLLKVSNSDIATFKRCRRKWNLGSFNRRNLIARKPSTALWIGTGGHYALEHWKHYGGEHGIIDAFEQWVDKEYYRFQDILGGTVTEQVWKELQVAVNIGREVLVHYSKYAQKNDPFRMVAREYEFSVPIPNVRISLHDSTGRLAQWVVNTWGEKYWENEDFKKTYVDRGLHWHADDALDDRTYSIPALFVGRLDGIVQMVEDPSIYFVIDHKFLRRTLSEETLLIDEQTSKYIWAARVAHSNGWWNVIDNAAKIRGVYYNIIIKKPPKIPELLKSGKTSTAKITTTKDVFLKTLKERKQDPADYKEALAKLENAEEKFFVRHRILRSQHEIDLVGDRLYYEYADMQRVHELNPDIRNPAIYPSPTKDCAWECQFRQACYAANYGGDAEYLLREAMQVSDRTYYIDSEMFEAMEYFDE